VRERTVAAGGRVFRVHQGLGLRRNRIVAGPRSQGSSRPAAEPLPSATDLRCFAPQRQEQPEPVTARKRLQTDRVRTAHSVPTRAACGFANPMSQLHTGTHPEPHEPRHVYTRRDRKRCGGVNPTLQNATNAPAEASARSVRPRADPCRQSPRRPQLWGWPVAHVSALTCARTHAGRWLLARLRQHRCPTRSEYLPTAPSRILDNGRGSREGRNRTIGNSPNQSDGVRAFGESARAST
jgi:hypothetical protein